LNIDILIFPVKKDLDKSYKINCEYEIKQQTNDFTAPCGNQESFAPLSGTCHPPPSVLIKAATDTESCYPQSKAVML